MISIEEKPRHQSGVTRMVKEKIHVSLDLRIKGIKIPVNKRIFP
jgi:hypothetical protein